MDTKLNSPVRVEGHFMDVGAEPLRNLPPLHGYSNEPLVSLQKSVEKLDQQFYDMNRMVWGALENRKHPVDDLTQDEAAAIYLYTMEWPGEYPSLYKLLNETLRSENRKSAMKPWLSYLKLILTALKRLPSARCTVWRGVREDIRDRYKKDEHIIWWSFSSCTTSLSILQKPEFVGTSDKYILFLIECFNGKKIQLHSCYPKEEEVLLLPGTYLKVVGTFNIGPNKYIIHVREEEPPHPMLELPWDIKCGKETSDYVFYSSYMNSQNVSDNSLW